MAAPAPSLRARALRLLATREYSRIELERKLARTIKPSESESAPDLAVLAALLDELQALGLLDEQRFAESLARRRQAKYGSQRIALELRSHGLDGDLVDRVLGAQREPELLRAQHILHRRYPEPAATAQERARQQRFLLARGFGREVVMQAIRGDRSADDSYLAGDADGES
ncbi:MAG: regulatory protein RecX [Proteobacteria bacterium]|nr:regulatory protein RecX [Pseudomonadota bacterium]